MQSQDEVRARLQVQMRVRSSEGVLLGPSCEGSMRVLVGQLRRFCGASRRDRPTTRFPAQSASLPTCLPRRDKTTIERAPSSRSRQCIQRICTDSSLIKRWSGFALHATRPLRGFRTTRSPRLRRSNMPPRKRLRGNRPLRTSEIEASSRSRASCGRLRTPQEAAR